MMEYRVRNKISAEELEEKKGKVLTDDDYNILLTRPCKLRKPDGKMLAVYLPKVIPQDVNETSYEILHGFKGAATDNRGLASGSPRYATGGGAVRTRTKHVASAIIGSFDPQGGGKNFCRLTAWTGKETEKFENLYPLFQTIAEKFQEYVPDRFAKQMDFVNNTHPDWIIPKTPFTTITINNTYPTGVHTDKGDLDEGFSTLACLRRGEFTGGRLIFPEYRVGVDMQDGDIVLMDAHEWHGNTFITCACGEHPNDGWREVGPCRKCGAERVSVVCYYRTKMGQCEAKDEEDRKRILYAEKRSIRVGA